MKWFLKIRSKYLWVLKCQCKFKLNKPFSFYSWFWFNKQFPCVTPNWVMHHKHMLCYFTSPLIMIVWWILSTHLIINYKTIRVIASWKFTIKSVWLFLYKTCRVPVENATRRKLERYFIFLHFIFLEFFVLNSILSSEHSSAVITFLNFTYTN